MIACSCLTAICAHAAPALKQSPAPINTTHRTSSLVRAVFRACASSAESALFKAFFAAGRFSVIVAYLQPGDTSLSSSSTFGMVSVSRS